MPLDILTGLLTYLLFAGTAFAQVPDFAIAQTIEIADKEAISGDIMSIDGEGKLIRTKVEGDVNMYGVLVADPQIVYKTREEIPIARSGTALINVTTEGGEIKVGDLITSSTTAGKGKRAEGTNGYMIGVAVASFGSQEGTPVTVNGREYRQGPVMANIGIGPASPVLVRAEGGLFGTLRQLARSILFNISTSRQLERLIRYLLAILLVLLVIWISYRTFGKNITKGIEAIGRNPLAKNTIQTVIILNVVLIFLVSLGGILLALAIISL